MRFLRRLYHRLIAWRAGRRVDETAAVVPDFAAHEPTIARDVSRQGVRFFSLCGGCGARLSSSATLCDECAHVKGPKWRN